jgi:polyferredoxin
VVRPAADALDLLRHAVPSLDRGSNAPDQALLLDFAHGRLYAFFIEVWPQDLYLVTGLLVLASTILILTNALAGRLWCGFACPQTVWTDLFLLVEGLIEGDRRRLQIPVCKQ